MILAAVIAGGRSTRFGSDKALVPIAGRPMIDHVVAMAAGIAAAVVICGRDHAGSVVLGDRPGPGLGPLGGVNAALHYAAANGFAAVLTLPCDTPQVSPAVLAAVAGHQGAAILAACPVIARWPADLADALDRFLADGADRSIRTWARQVGAAELAGPAPVNVNRPEDLSRLERSGAE